MDRSETLQGVVGFVIDFGHCSQDKGIKSAFNQII